MFFIAQCAVLRVANGPHVDEATYITAGLRLLGGFGNESNYHLWFNGSPYFWPPLAGLGFSLGGLAGARFIVVLLSVGTLASFYRFASNVFDRDTGFWATVALAANGLFFAQAHNAVYDGLGLFCIAGALALATEREPKNTTSRVILAGVAMGLAVVAKYGFLALLPSVALVVLGWPFGVLRWREAVLFVLVSGCVIVLHDVVVLNTIVPSSLGAFTRHIAVDGRAGIVQRLMYFGWVPLSLIVPGYFVAKQRGHLRFALLALGTGLLFPVMHVVLDNHTSLQKHVVAGGLLCVVLMGMALAALGARGWRVGSAVALTMLIVVGYIQSRMMDQSWTDLRPVAAKLAELRAGDEMVLSEFAWIYKLYLGNQPQPGAINRIGDQYAEHTFEDATCQPRWVVGSTYADGNLAYWVETPVARAALNHCQLTPVFAQVIASSTLTWLWPERALTQVVIAKAEPRRTRQHE